MQIKTILIFVCCLSLLFWSCKQQYAYRSKVRVGSTTKPSLVQEKKEKANTSETLFSQEEETPIFASNDSNLVVVNPTYFNKQKDNIIDQKVKEKEKETGFKKKEHTFINKPKPTINYYAKWALIMGLISLTVIPFILPIFLGPLDIALGIIALKQINKSGEKGKGRAIYALLIGLFFTTLLLTDAFQFLPIPTILLFAAGVVLFNLIVLMLIKKGRKNPANKEEVEKRKPLSKRTKNLLIFSYVFAFLTAAFSAILVGLALGPATWLFAQEALKRMPKDESNRRFITQLAMVLGLLATIALFVLIYSYLFVTLDYGSFIIAVILILLALIFTLIAFLILNNYPKVESAHELE